MCALSNANTVEEDASSSGLAPIAFPEATNSRTGVSVEYVHDPTGNKKWYLFRAIYGRENMAADILTAAGIYTYIPKRLEMTVVGGQKKKVLRNLMPSLLFAYMTRAEADTCTRDIPFLTYYYDHFHTENGKNPPLVIPANQMHNLVLATQSHNENIMLLHEGAYTFKSDEEVEVMEGTFQGVRGRVIRAGRQQRIMITLTGLGSIATAYVPTAFLRPVCQKSI